MTYDAKKVSAKPKTKRLQKERMDVLPGSGVSDADLAMLESIQNPGWQVYEGLHVQVASGGRAYRTPTPFLTTNEYPVRSAYAKFETTSGTTVWRRLEAKTDYTNLRQQHGLLPRTATTLVTILFRKS